MRDGTNARNDTFDVAIAVGGELIGGGKTFAFAAVADGDKARVDNGADERDAVGGRLAKAFFRVEGEIELFFKKMVNDIDIAQKLRALGGGDDDKEIINVAAVMGIAEVVDDKTVELVEKDVRKELGSQIANDDTATFGLVKKTFRAGQIVPVGREAAENDVTHGIVMDNLVPEKL